MEASKLDGLRAEDLKTVAGVQSVVIRGGTLRIGVRDLAADSPGILQWLAARGHAFTHIASERASLESVFLTLTGRSLRD